MLHMGLRRKRGVLVGNGAKGCIMVHLSQCCGGVVVPADDRRDINLAKSGRGGRISIFNFRLRKPGGAARHGCWPWSPPMAEGIFTCQRVAGVGRGGKKVVPPLLGRFGADDERGNEDLPGFSMGLGWETKCADCVRGESCA